jgi:O-antigen ligase
MWADHPILGVGVGTFPIAYGLTYRDPSFANQVWYDAHSSAIKVLAELGTPGFVAWCGMIIAGLVALSAACRYRSRSDVFDPMLEELAALGRTLRVSLIGYLVCSMFLARSYDWMLMVFLGLAVSCSMLIRRRLSGMLVT